MSYIVTHPFYGPPIYHHTTCPAIKRWYRGGEQPMLLPPVGAVACRRCGGAEYVKIELTPAQRRKPVGSFHINRHGLHVPDSCPACGSEAIERDSGKLWFCWMCDWSGSVNSKTWTLSKDRTVLSLNAKRGTDQSGPGRAVPRRSSINRSLAS